MPITGVATMLFYYVGGVGIRDRSRFAALAVFIVYFLDTVPGLSVLRVVLGGALLSNLRATWIAAGREPESEEAILPPRLNETLFDRLADQLPAWLWPKLRIPYYIYASGFLLSLIAGLAAAISGKVI
jgi:hypothetical protein